ncbi:MAG: hypothetical protein IJM14_05330 [Lachnospiraceae bacterium]|nr:hypothetical protein [Lachnospiraceae bacterium]
MSESPNKNNKDRLFKMIYGREENKAWTLSLYNAINGSDYTNPDDIKINTIDDVMYLGMKNDVSFIISETMNIYEQQASYNPNMPIRQMIYAGKLYSKYVEDNGVNIYGSGLKKFPAPKLICFYNGGDERPEREILNLSDAFEKPEEADIDAKVTMININYGKNEKLMEACRTLREYAWIVDAIRRKRKKTDLDKAIEETIRELDEEALLKPFLMGHLAEVKDMCLREYSEDEIKEMFKKDGLEEGLQKGLQRGVEKTRISAVKNMMQKLGLSLENAMDVLMIPEDERKVIIQGVKDSK